MTKNPVIVALIDDEFPSKEEFVEKGIFDNPINSEDLYELTISANWGPLRHLQQLIKDIVCSEAATNNQIELMGFKNPNIFLPELESGFNPNIIIYDWEYGMPGTEPRDWLLEILELSKTSFVFAYSQVRDSIPIFLNKSDFTPYAERFQLFLKGSSGHSIFSSEEFILQYILGKVSNSGRIKLQGFEVEFTSNDYLAQASDILYLERILGRKYILEEFKKYEFNVDKDIVEKILDDSKQYLLLNVEKGILISPDEQTLIEKLQPLKEMSFLDVCKEYSIQKLEETLEKGMSLV